MLDNKERIEGRLYVSKQTWLEGTESLNDLVTRAQSYINYEEEIMSKDIEKD